MGDKSDIQDNILFWSMINTNLKGSNYLQWSHAIHVFLKACGILLFPCRNFKCTRRFNGRGIKQCTQCGRNNHYVDGDNSSSILVEHVLISKTEYDSLFQSANPSSSSMVALGYTCLRSSSSPRVIDSRASNHMTGNSALLSNISNTSSPSFVIVANGTKNLSKGLEWFALLISLFLMFYTYLSLPLIYY